MSSLWGLRYLETQYGIHTSVFTVHGIFTIGGQIYLRYLETHALVYRLEAGYIRSVGVVEPSRGAESFDCSRRVLVTNPVFCQCSSWLSSLVAKHILSMSQASLLDFCRRRDSRTPFLTYEIYC